MGENGAGKSTLIKVLTGVYAIGRRHDRAGRPSRCAFAGPLQAQQAGISTVYQEVNLCPNLSVAENIFIGREPRRFGRIHWARMRRRRRGAGRRPRTSTSTSPRRCRRTRWPCSNWSRSSAAPWTSTAKVLILDEPTSSLDRDEVAQLFARDAAAAGTQGVAILFVSHFLDQIYEICDRMTVLRNGTLVGEHLVSELEPGRAGQPHDRQGAGRAGGAVEARRQARRRGRRAAPRGATASAAPGAIEPFDLNIQPGRGRRPRRPARLRPHRARPAAVRRRPAPTAARCSIDGKPVALRTPRAAIGHGIAFCSENRKTEGLVPELTVRENIILALQAARGWTRPLSRAAAGRTRRRSTSRRWTSARPTPRRRSATSAAATSRRCCSPAG